MHETHDHRLQESYVCLFGKQAHCVFDVFVVCEVYFLADEETFFHADAEISYPFDLFAFLPVANCELRHPDAINIFLVVFNDVVENNVEENKQLHPHKFIVLSISDEHFYFRVMGVKDKNILLGVD